jgi:hypothetical protein
MDDSAVGAEICQTTSLWLNLEGLFARSPSQPACLVRRLERWICVFGGWREMRCPSKSPISPPVPRNQHGLPICSAPSAAESGFQCDHVSRFRLASCRLLRPPVPLPWGMLPQNADPGLSVRPRRVHRVWVNIRKISRRELRPARQRPAAASEMQCLEHAIAAPMEP